MKKESKELYQLYTDMVSYIEQSQKELTKQAKLIDQFKKNSHSQNNRLTEKISCIVNEMVKAGEIPSEFAEPVKNEFVKNPDKIFDMFLHKGFPVQKMGNSSNYKQQFPDAIVEFAFS